MTSWSGGVNYIDGFAGPGEYLGGEEGSPLIALSAILGHGTKLRANFWALFVEADRERYEVLRRKVTDIPLPKNIRAGCHCGKFEDVMTGILDNLDRKASVIAPTFVFIDPFGFSIPISIVKRIMSRPRCEVLITFMYEEINRFIGDPKLWDCLTQLYGNDEWQRVIPIKDPGTRVRELQGIYKRQLEAEAAIRFVTSFKMTNKANRTDYFLFFGTNHLMGLKKMKAAMWDVDESGSFEFSDATYNPAQPTLFQTKPNYQSLKKAIIDKFGGMSVKVVDLETFILTQTPFRETHYKRPILAPMEREGEIKVNGAKDRRRGSFPENCVIEFL
jgi:three-Cys-motif partner protein